MAAEDELRHKRTGLRREIYDRVASHWTQLGLSGQAPAVRAFETDQPVVYHEEGAFEPGAHRAPGDAPSAPSM